MHSEEKYLFPCSIVQKTCWLFDQTSPGNPSSNIAVRFQLQGPLQVDLFEAALVQVVQRHETLRTRFIAKDGEPKQLVEPQARFELPLMDLRRLPEEQRWVIADLQASDEARIGFDLENGPLFRGRLLQLGDEEFVLLLTMHHIISDGWSVGLVTDEAGSIYSSLVQGAVPSLPDLAFQYADYACWQDEWVQSGALKAELAHWKERLDGFTPIRIATDLERPVNPTNRGDIRSMVLPRALTDSIRTLSERHGCTLFTTMLAAFLAVLNRETGQTDLVLKTPLAGRSRVELEPVIGWFVNPVILRTEVSPELPFAELMKRTQRTVLEAFEHGDVAFERVMEVVRPKNISSRQPPFQVNFIMQRDFVKPWKHADVALTPLPSKSAGVFVDLNFFLVEREDGWRASVDVNLDVFRVETGDWLLQAYVQALQGIAGRPGIVVQDIPVLPRPNAATNLTKVIEMRPTAPHVPSRNAQEEKIVKIWERLLDTHPISTTDNFFDLGGHSVLATKLASELQSAFGQEIKLAQLFAEPTPAAMARLLDPGHDKNGNDRFIRVQPEGARPPFFLIGGDHWFRPLAVHIGMDQPFIGIPLISYGNLNDDQVRRTAAREIAARMMEFQPGGKFLLGGWCDAGVTAFEVARALDDLGATVGMVVLLDAMNPDYYRSLEAMAAAGGRALDKVREVIRTNRQQGVIASLSSAARDMQGKLRRGVSRLPNLFHTTYISEHVTFPMVVIRPPLHGPGDPELGWRRVCPNALSVEEVPGDHTSILREPNVVFVADAVRRSLDTATGRYMARAHRQGTA